MRQKFEDRIGLKAFLRVYPGMRVRPSGSGNFKLRGEFAFEAKPQGGATICDTYVISISASERFPGEVPIVWEEGERIPRTPDHHVNPDGSLCLGSPARLLILASLRSTLTGFAEKCIIPFLYAASCREQNGGEWPFGELAHGLEGELDDYMDLLRVDTRAQVLRALELLGMKRRRANKKPCPCGCSRRLGRCRYNQVIRRVRALIGRPPARKIYRRLLRLCGSP